MDAAAEIGWIPPRVSTRFSLSAEDERAGAGRDVRTRLARPNSQARTGGVRLTTSRNSNRTRLIPNLLYVMTLIHAGTTHPSPE